MWDEVPQFYSVDTRTAFVERDDGLQLADSVQQSVQNQTATLNAYVPISPQFNLRESRDIGAVRVTATPTRQVDVSGGFTSTGHSGELPWGGSFGFNNNTEVALPYRSRTNDLDVGAEWTNTRSMFRTAYTGSWFNNENDTLVWDSPLRLTDGVELPGRGRTALWPSNSLQTVSAAGYTKFARRTQLTGSLSFGWWDNDEPLLPFTINSALPSIALPRATRRGRGADGRHQREPRVAPGGRVAAQRSLPPLRLLQRDARHRDRPVRQLRLRGLDELDRRAQAAGTRPEHPRGRSDVDAPHRWRCPSATPTITMATTRAFSSRPTSTCCTSRPMPPRFKA